MKFSAKDIDRLTHLAKVEMSKEQEEKFAQQLTKIVSWAQQLDEINTDDVTALRSLNKDQTPTRKDEHLVGNKNGDNIADLVLSNAPDMMQNMYCVPKVIE